MRPRVQFSPAAPCHRRVRPAIIANIINVAPLIQKCRQYRLTSSSFALRSARTVVTRYRSATIPTATIIALAILASSTFTYSALTLSLCHQFFIDNRRAGTAPANTIKPAIIPKFLKKFCVSRSTISSPMVQKS